MLKLLIKLRGDKLKMQKCLLIKTKDKRDLFTKVENFPRLKKFSQIFGAEICVVEADHPEILSTKKLVNAICDSGYKCSTNYTVLETKIDSLPTQLSGRELTLDTAFRIRSYIETEFLKGNVVSLHAIEDKFKKYGLSTSAICNHVSKVKETLSKQGYEFKKVSAGKYQVT